MLDACFKNLFFPGSSLKSSFSFKKEHQAPLRSIQGKLGILWVAMSFFHLSSPLMAQSQVKPDSKKDMLTPSEVPLETPNSTPNNQNGPFLGTSLSFGQGRTTEGTANPGVATFFKFEPGYQIGTGSWNRIEVSGELLRGGLSFRQTSGSLAGKQELDVDFGFIAKFGYGYSLGSRMFGLAKLGAGALSGSLKATANGQSAKSDSITGTALFVGWTMVMPFADSFDFTAGLNWTHSQFDVGTLRAGNATYDYSQSLVLNIPTVDLGLRLRL